MSDEKRLVYAALLFDSSGSMMGVSRAARESLESSLTEYKNAGEKTEVHVGLMFFSSEPEEVIDCLPASAIDPKEVAAMYKIYGLTALYDSIAAIIRQTDLVLSARERAGQRPFDRVAVTIYTDGEENNSKEYAVGDVKALIQEREKQGWQFLFAASNIDHRRVGGSLGVQRTSGFAHTARGMSNFTDAAVAFSMGTDEDDAEPSVVITTTTASST